jgi:hypothetical protein
MLFPFHGYLGDGSDPTTSAVAAARARRIREDAGRYQPDRVLADAVAQRLLRRPSAPSLFVYRVTLRSGRTVEGVVGEVPVQGLVPHERTVRRRVEPATVVEIRPVLAVTRDRPPPWTIAGRASVVVEGGRRHEAAPVRVSGPAFGDGPLVIADGHHRVRAVRRTRGPQGRVLTMVIGDGGRGLSVSTFHRVFEGVGPLPVSAGEAFEVTPTDIAGPSRRGLVWVQGSGERFLLTARREVLDAMPEALRSSAAAVAAAALYPRVGLTEDRARYEPTSRAALARLGSGDVALLLPPASMETVLAAAETGTLLPPKGTRFSPKPVRGLILRLAGSA